MMSSAIPARLQFQCGHAALVTLPRVKGESTAQRNQRIAREKSDALIRQCDFCGPTVAVAAATRPEEVNGTHMTAADVVAAQPVTAPLVIAAEPVIVPEPVIEPEPVVVAELVVVVEEPVTLAAVPVLEVRAAPEPSAEPLPVVQPVTRRARRQTTPKPVAQRVDRTSQVVSRGYTFLVEYQVEHVLRAANMRDALRQTAALGASEILAITREGS